MSPFGRAFTDGDRLEVAGAVVRLRVNRRARRVSLRLDRARREIVATAPSPRRLAEAAAFANDRAAWIAERLAELPATAPVGPGLELEVFGEAVRLEAGTGRARWLAPEDGSTPRIVAMGEGEGYARAVILVLRRRALEVLTERTAWHCGRLGVAVPKVTVTDTRSRWGSCRPAVGRLPASIRYSWRLALAPFEVADYVAAHESAHLLELNHGPRFWAHVRGLVGDERRHREWLRAEGARLHAFGR
ncbi:conserved predicted metal-dependent hydrolase [Phenylobacterium zucineum HLK1]|uniref:Conserved predicted metal-dependent hydrolase n=1 Tax=Phenylobacterium zucineum (strain HLK1) TaxID=450851 RepID=B4RD40_PHEZH|nr:YgjP-like metallopeptidase domain-containing protein [Phenylobacterium zucineum]ACG76644.1 conserved predicted metal-dependent hydrolase [Phenylobacterium zucineum HLK1]